MTDQFNFRVPEEIKKAFIREAKMNGTSATELLVDFMARYAGLEPKPPEAAVTYSELEERITPLEERLAVLEAMFKAPKAPGGAYILK